MRAPDRDRSVRVIPPFGYPASVFRHDAGSDSLPGRVPADPQPASAASQDGLRRDPLGAGRVRGHQVHEGTLLSPCPPPPCLPVTPGSPRPRTRVVRVFFRLFVLPPLHACVSPPCSRCRPVFVFWKHMQTPHAPPAPRSFIYSFHLMPARPTVIPCWKSRYRNHAGLYGFVLTGLVSAHRHPPMKYAPLLRLLFLRGRLLMNY